MSFELREYYTFTHHTCMRLSVSTIYASGIVYVLLAISMYFMEQPFVLTVVIATCDEIFDLICGESRTLGNSLLYYWINPDS